MERSNDYVGCFDVLAMQNDTFSIRNDLITDKNYYAQKRLQTLPDIT